ncbi:MAG: 3-deoxy-7-phosphoheptulonate synthase [Kiritimatiellae bacterium]|nr:3-deoxy-7-phosphoheptulonate synthase [Kiritimatiellia bacterium]MDW8458407.1 3-deoxy-7-phosphoheptulonate synthase [Verrucomicrobiota bacterium]
MIIVLKPDATAEQIAEIEQNIRDWGLRPQTSKGTERTVIGVIGDESLIANKPLDVFPGVESVLRIQKPYKLASREFRPASTNIVIPWGKPGGEPVVIGGDQVIVVGGPCSVEKPEVMLETARHLIACGARMLRAGAFKPRTSPYAFQGLGVEGLRILAEIRRETGLPFVTEVMDTRDVEMVAELADVVQIGARNTQNFSLLKAVGRTRTPVLLKRGIAGTVEELLMSAEYILSQGNDRVILCERGIRTFEKATRNTLDLNAVPVLKKLSHLPVAVDPSHGIGIAEFVVPMALAGVACGADLLLVEMHPEPQKATSDGAQTINPEQFRRLMEGARGVAAAIGRTV